MRFRTLLTLRPGERRALAAALPLLAATRAALWLLPSRRVVREVGRLAALPPSAPSSAVTPGEVAWAVDVASRLVPGATCLPQAVATHLLLCAHGHAAELCVGVGSDVRGGFRAHAWVELRGRVIVGGRASRSLARLPLPVRP